MAEKPRRDDEDPATDVLKTMVSLAKMDVIELKQYTLKINEFLKTPGAAAIRICECCVDVSIT
jgi:hypothetical protein